MKRNNFKTREPYSISSEPEKPINDGLRTLAKIIARKYMKEHQIAQHQSPKTDLGKPDA